MGRGRQVLSHRLGALTASGPLMGMRQGLKQRRRAVKMQGRLDTRLGVSCVLCGVRER